MLKIIIVISLLVASLAAKSIEVIPAKIDFKNNTEVDIVEEVYMMIHNGISLYNSQQDEAYKLISVKESFLPVRKYKKKIIKYYSKNKSAHKKQYMREGGLDLLVEYRVKGKDVRALRKCKRHCNVHIQIFVFKKDGSFSKSTLKLDFDKSVESLTDDSYTQVDELMLSKLD